MHEKGVADAAVKHYSLPNIQSARFVATSPFAKKDEKIIQRDAEHSSIQQHEHGLVHYVNWVGLNLHHLYHLAILVALPHFVARCCRL